MKLIMTMALTVGLLLTGCEASAGSSPQHPIYAECVK